MYVYICMYVYIYGGNFFPIMERGGFPLSHRVLWVFPPISNHGSVQQTCWTAWQSMVPLSTRQVLGEYTQGV
jgi:hypothetical protein